MSTLEVNPDIVNILGEVLWHSATLGNSIEEVSKDHAKKY